MKPAIFTGVIFAAFLSCTYDNVTPPADLTPAVREIHYQWDGQRMGVNTLTYDANNNLTHEYFKAEIESRQDLEKSYEYDASGRLVKKSVGNPVAADSYYITEITYVNDLTASQVEHYIHLDGMRTVYYYTGTRLDSLSRFSYPGGEALGNRNTDILVYDDKQRVVQEGPSNYYQYDDNNRLISSCDGDVDSGTAVRCYLTEYNSVGQVLKIYEYYPGVRIKNLRQENYYKKGRLAERWNYQWIYTSGPAPDIQKIKYEY